MVLATNNLWEIVVRKRQYHALSITNNMNTSERWCKNFFNIMPQTWWTKELAHIKCNIHETKSFSNILFIRTKFFTIKLDKGDDMFNHINNVKCVADQLACLLMSVNDKDMIMIFFENMFHSLNHFITMWATKIAHNLNQGSKCFKKSIIKKNRVILVDWNYHDILTIGSTTFSGGKQSRLKQF